jgi:hypothetical protein
MATPERYQTFVERSITPSGMGIETYFVLDSQTNERVAKCRSQAEAATIANGLNAAIRAFKGSVCSRATRLKRLVAHFLDSRS